MEIFENVKKNIKPIFGVATGLVIAGASLFGALSRKAPSVDDYDDAAEFEDEINEEIEEASSDEEEAETE